MPPERFLDRFINDAHAAAADLAEHAVLAKLDRRRFSGERFAPRTEAGLDLGSSMLFDQHQGCQDLLELVGQFRIFLSVLRDGGSLAPPVAIDELLSEAIDGVTFGL